MESTMDEVIAVDKQQARFLRIRHEIIIAEKGGPNLPGACMSANSGTNRKRKTHRSPTLFPFMI